MSREILIVAGEPSGDQHAAGLVAALRRRDPALKFWGVGGPAMRGVGVETLEDADRLAVAGVTEVIRHFPLLRRVFFRVVRAALDRRPAGVILVDYPGFNLRLAERLHKGGLTIIYYICPQVWAWNRRRIPRMARHLDRLITIFPFEPAWFEGTGLAVKFAGHPLVDEAEAVRKRPPVPLPWDGDPKIAVLPGSRIHEIQRLLGPMWVAAARLQQRHPSASFLVAAASVASERLIQKEIQKLGKGPTRWGIVTGQTWEVLRQARAAWIASGTATVQAALMRCPMVIAYRVSWLTAMLARAVIRVPHLGMVNLLAGEQLCPECLQRRCTGPVLADALAPLIDDGPRRQTMLCGLDAVVASLGPPGASDRAAEFVLEALPAASVG